MELELPDVEEARKSRLNGMVAITVVILAVFTAVCKIKDDNIVQSMQVLKADTVDTWSEYQSKRLKVYINESSIGQAEVTKAVSADPAATQAYIDKLTAKDKELQSEANALKAKAEDMGKQYDALGYRDDQFDLSDALLSIAVAVAAVASLTEKRQMLILSWIFGAGGMLFGVAGFAQWALHPDWIIKFLT